MNVITFSGRLAADAEVRYTASGTSVTSFNVANDVGFGDKKRTNWFRCSMFGQRGEKIASYLTKGGKVVVSGELSLDEYTDRDGNKRSSMQVRVNEVDLPPRQDATPRQDVQAPPQTDGFDDTIPF